MMKTADQPVDTASHFLYPAGIFASPEACEVHTILGSCVAVCLVDPILKHGGINHFMLPLWNGEGLESPKYGNIAIAMLLERMLQMGSQRRNLVAKIFGGASQFENSVINVGERNIQLAETVLERNLIPIQAKSLGGPRGRKIVFNTFTGQVMMKYIVKGMDY